MSFKRQGKILDSTGYFKSSELFIFLSSSLEQNNFKKVLEIGSFEGVFSCWAAQKFAIEVHTIDPFDRNDQGTKIGKKTEETFHRNVENSGNKEKITLYKKTSDEFFNENKYIGFFDFIYVDGSHEPEVAIRDLENSLRVCKNGGVIWIDDFGSNYKTLNIEIQKWLDRNAKRIKIVHMNYQVGLIKIS
jgi:predicted O-methyltransferase YrrM